MNLKVMKCMGVSSAMFTALTLVLLFSFGIVHAANPAVALDPLYRAYEQGETVTISGKVNYSVGAMSQEVVTVKIHDPNAVIVQVDQFTPNRDGTFEYDFVIGELWKYHGDYRVSFYVADQPGSAIMVAYQPVVGIEEVQGSVVIDDVQVTEKVADIVDSSVIVEEVPDDSKVLIVVNEGRSMEYLDPNFGSVLAVVGLAAIPSTLLGLVLMARGQFFGK